MQEDPITQELKRELSKAEIVEIIELNPRHQFEVLKAQSAVRIAEAHVRLWSTILGEETKNLREVNQA